MSAAFIPLEAYAAALGTAQVAQAAIPSVGSGFQVSAGLASYPTELLHFLPDRHYISREVIKFWADGYVWDNHCTAAMHGFFSQSQDPLVCMPDVSSSIPANRYIKSVSFSEGTSSQTISSGLLTVMIQPQDTVGGSAAEPYLQFLVNGRFDPVGFGDTRYEFLLQVDSHATVSAAHVHSSEGVEITNEDDHVLVYLNQ